jgi:pectin methylesterase-like acyl-CoA thioesterase
MALHRTLTASDGIHIAFAFSYADEAARTGATGLTADDVGKMAQQVDNKTYWILSNHSPVTWIAVAGGLTNPMTTRGDVIFGGTGGSPSRLAGVAGAYLRSGGSAADPTFVRAVDADSLIASATVGATPDASAILQADSTTKGFLMPRMTEAQRNAITTPAVGLMVYEPIAKRVWFYDGSVWCKLVVGQAKVVTVAADGTGDFTGIQDAIDSILDAADLNRYVVEVSPGVYNEDVVMADYIQVSGAGWDSLVQGQIVCSGLEYTQINDMRVESENKPALDVDSVGGEVNVTGCFLFAGWDDTASPATVRCCVEIEAGTVYLYKESEATCSNTDAVNTAPTTIQTVYHLQGTDEIYLECYGQYDYIETVNGGNTLCCIYSTNTSEDTEVLNQLGNMDFAGLGTHSNPISLIKHVGANGATGFAYKQVAGTMGSGGTPSFIVADCSNSPAASVIRTAFCRSRVAGIADADTYTARSTHATDKVWVFNHLFSRIADTLPGRNTSGGSAGAYYYTITNTFGTGSSSGQFNGVEQGADVTDWTNVSAALGGQAGANAAYVFQSDGAGGGTMAPNVAAITRRLKVGLGGGVQYTSIKSAVDAAIAGGASATSPWLIEVYPGTYTEAAFNLQSGIVLRGTDVRMDTVFVVASDPTNDLITSTGGYIAGLNLSGVTTSGKCLIRCATALSLTVLHGVSLRKCDQGLVVSNGAKCIATSFSINLNGVGQTVGTGLFVTGSGSYFAVTGGFFSCPSALLPGYAANPIQTGVKVADSAKVFLTSCTFQIAYKTTDADALFVETGGEVGLFSSEVSGCANATHIGSSGTGSRFIIQAASFQGNVKNGFCESSTGRYFILASAEELKWDAVSGSGLSGITQLRSSSKTYIIGAAAYSFPTGVSADFQGFFHDQVSTGLGVGGEVTAATGLTVDVAAGDGWITRHDPDHDSFNVSWDAEASLDLTASSTNYVVYNSVTSGIEVLLSSPGETAILLATVVTDGSGIRYLHQTRNVVHNESYILHNYLLNVRKIRLKSGLGVVEGSTARKFDVGSGVYYRALDEISYAGGSDVTFSSFYGTNGATEVSGQTELNITQYDNAGTLTSFTTGYFRSDTVILTSDGRVNVVFGTAQYASQVLAEAASVGNVPTFMEASACTLAQVIVEEGEGIVSVLDRRPTDAGSGGSAGGVSVHSALAGLSADDHTQYLLVSGTRAMSGALNMGSQNITSAGTVNGVTVEGHASRHNPGGTDALALGTPVAVQIGASAAEGSAASLARSDHQHGVTAGTPVAVGTANSAGSGTDGVRANHVHDHGSQSTATHHAVCTTGANGFMSSTDKTKLDGVATGATNTPLTSTAPVNVTKAAAVVGVSTEAARQDHKHDITTGSPVAAAIGDTQAEGTATSLARSDHRHAVSAGTPVSVGTANAEGAAATFARSNHVHSGLTRGAADINSFTEKATPVSADVLLIEDSADSYNKKKVQVGNLPGGGTAPVFGTEFQQSSKDGTESVTGTAWTQYHRFTTASLPAGTYRIGFWHQFAHGSTSNSFESRVQVDDTTEILTHVQEIQDPAGAQRNTIAGFAYVTFLTSTTHNIDVDYKAGSAATTAYMHLAGIEVWRVA